MFRCCLEYIRSACCAGSISWNFVTN